MAFICGDRCGPPIRPRRSSSPSPPPPAGSATDSAEPRLPPDSTHCQLSWLGLDRLGRTSDGSTAAQAEEQEGDPDLAFGMGVLRLTLGQPQRAKVFFEASQQLHGDHPATWHTLRLCQQCLAASASRRLRPTSNRLRSACPLT